MAENITFCRNGDNGISCVWTCADGSRTYEAVTGQNCLGLLANWLAGNRMQPDADNGQGE